MKLHKTEIPDLLVVEPERIEDERGYFTRSFCESEFAGQDIAFSPVQSNISYNRSALTLRGMHYHAPPYEETKLVRCSSGRLFDVAVDLRLSSPTYLAWFGVELSRKNGLALFIPAGFAHGFLTLEDETEVFYQMSPAYVPGHELGFCWNDPSIGIDWPGIPEIISDKDQILGTYS
jgi:dTDP-4-dehydrorhamnose 3,5-epimerase